jgi:hypothetical protein
LGNTSADAVDGLIGRVEYDAAAVPVTGSDDLLFDGKVAAYDLVRQVGVEARVERADARATRGRDTANEPGAEQVFRGSCEASLAGAAALEILGGDVEVAVKQEGVGVARRWRLSEAKAFERGEVLDEGDTFSTTDAFADEKQEGRRGEEREKRRSDNGG